MGFYCRKKDTILEWAARYEIENDERLYQSLQAMKKRGGPATLKTFWENIRTRTTAYNQIIDNEIYVKVRSTGKLLKAKINLHQSNSADVNLKVSEDGISPGQACVFYIRDDIGYKVLGGGWIKS